VTPASAPETPPAGRSARWRRWLEPAIGIGLFAVAAWVLHSELEQVSYEEIVAALGALPVRAELLALAFMAANYVVLTGFDLLAFVYIGKRIAAWRIMIASFVGYSISNNVGFTLLSGTSARYRFYSRWGLSPGDLSRVVVFYTGTFWVGLLLLGGWVLAFDPPPALGLTGRMAAFRGLGVLLLACAAAYAIIPFFRTAPIRIHHFLIPVPPPRLVLGQYVLSTVDWLLAASIFYALLPPGGPAFGQVLGAFIAAQLIAMLSHVPGGLGVFEGTMLLMLGGQVPTETLIGSLILFRIAYYLIPLAVALLILLGDEVIQRRVQVRRLGSSFGSLALEVVPKVLSVFVFLAGAALLLGGARPTNPLRMDGLLQWAPLPVVEVAHVASGVIGILLLVLAHGIGRRLRAAHRWTAGFLAVGIVVAVLRGGDIEEAIFLAGVLTVLGPSHLYFDRESAIWQARFSGGWVFATTAVVTALFWLGLLTYRHTGLVGPMLWQWEPHADAPRFLRTSAAVALALVALGIARLKRPRPDEARPPSADEAAAATRLLQEHPGPLDLDRLRGDTSLLWTGARDAFFLYRVSGRRWFAFGDPVGPRERTGELVRRFVERADDFAAEPVFIGISAARLEAYRDYGLVVAPLDDGSLGLPRRRDGTGEERLFLAFPGGLPQARLMDEVEALLGARLRERSG
jgi:phosphatidylglycerol lysyltransferase